MNGDGCNSNCIIETGYTCSGGTITTPHTCTEICGDGLSMGILGCDDGNVVNGDGCSSTCTVETGYTCLTTSKNSKSDCIETCGDGIYYGKKSLATRAAFACDDGNVADGDGCNKFCQ